MNVTSLWGKALKAFSQQKTCLQFEPEVEKVLKQLHELFGSSGCDSADIADIAKSILKDILPKIVKLRSCVGGEALDNIRSSLRKLQATTMTCSSAVIYLLAR